MVPLKELMTLDNVIAWLKTKDPNEVYKYTDGDNCLFAQYIRANGYTGVKARPGYIWSVEGNFTYNDQRLDDAASCGTASTETFGQALAIALNLPTEKEST